MAGLLSAWALAASNIHDPKAQYRFYCAQCHGLDGTARAPGVIRLPGRVLADEKWLAKQKEEDLLASILNGKGAMPSFKYKMAPEDAKRLLSEIIHPMTRSQVRRHRLDSKDASEPR